MLLDIQKILNSLGLVSCLLKPIPVVGDIVPGLIDTVGGIANSTLGPLLGNDGPLAPVLGDHGLLGSLIGPDGPLAPILGPHGLVGGLLGDDGPLGGLIGNQSPLGAITGSNGLLGGLTGGLLFVNGSALTNETISDIKSTGQNFTLVYNGTDPDTGHSTFILKGSPLNGTSTGNHSVITHIVTAVIPPVLNAAVSGASTTKALTSCTVTPWVPATPPVLESFLPFDAAEALVYRYRQQQSVNLGSWFVQEQWMIPTLFTCAAGSQQSELDLAMGYGSVTNAQSVLEQHWDQWIVESDFKYLASIGINTVRLPVGYWSLGPEFCVGTDFEPVAQAYINSWPRVVRAINWAAKYGVGVLVDLHGAVGSQNGQTHSGVSSGKVDLFNNPTNIALTMKALTYLTQQLVGVNNVVGIELLNEPVDDPSLVDFYDNALKQLRCLSDAASVFPFYIHDAFNLEKYASYVSNRTDFVVEDHHSYFVFAPQDPNESSTSLVNDINTSISQSLLQASDMTRRNLVIDEWSCALSAQSLAGSSDPEGDRRKFCTGQMQAYTNTTAGWSFWSYKTEVCDDDPNWCFTGRVGTSLPCTFFSYPNGTHSVSVLPAVPTSGPTNFFSFGSGNSSKLQGLSTPQVATLLLAAAANGGTGAGTNSFYSVNEMLAATPVDPAVGKAVPASAAPAAVVPGVQSNFESAPHSTPVVAAVSLMNNTLKGYRKRALTDTALSTLLTSIATPKRYSRLSARQLKQQQAVQGAAGTVGSAVDFTPEQSAIAQGYADGFKAAKSFAVFGGSRLGFTGQFINDALASSGTIAPANYAQYRTWFLNGLADGEVQVMNAL